MRIVSTAALLLSVWLPSSAIAQMAKVQQTPTAASQELSEPASLVARLAARNPQTEKTWLIPARRVRDSAIVQRYEFSVFHATRECALLKGRGTSKISSKIRKQGNEDLHICVICRFTERQLASGDLWHLSAGDRLSGVKHRAYYEAHPQEVVRELQANPALLTYNLFHSSRTCPLLSNRIVTKAKAKDYHTSSRYLCPECLPNRTSASLPSELFAVDYMAEYRQRNGLPEPQRADHLTILATTLGTLAGVLAGGSVPANTEPTKRPTSPAPPSHTPRPAPAASARPSYGSARWQPSSRVTLPIGQVVQVRAITRDGADAGYINMTLSPFQQSQFSSTAQISVFIGNTTDPSYNCTLTIDGVFYIDGRAKGFFWGSDTLPMQTFKGAKQLSVGTTPRLVEVELGGAPITCR